MYHEGRCVLVCDEGVCMCVISVCVCMCVCDEGVCDGYNHCGSFGYCGSATVSSMCECLRGFEPKSPQNWGAKNWSEGCGRELGTGKREK